MKAVLMKGLTLIELVIVIVLVTIVAGMVGVLLREGFRSYVTGRPIISVAGKANVALDNLMREIKSAENVSAMADHAFTFINQQGQTIVIDLSGTTLRRRMNGGAARALCSDVTGLSFAYFDAGFATTISPALVRFLTLNITVHEADIPYSLMAGTVIRKKL